MNLFDPSQNEALKKELPLAVRMRPRNLDEFIGQSHIIGEGRLLRRAIQADQLSSVIFYGPPGTGKTTLAKVIANTTTAYFHQLNAVTSGVADIRNVIKEAKDRLGMYGTKTILFIDEIHRFNKSQQDALLPHVEDSIITLIGATTENPYFEVNTALISRSRIFKFDPLKDQDVKELTIRALQDKERGLGKYKVKLDIQALEHLVAVAHGDARVAVNALELAVLTTPPDVSGLRHINLVVAEESIQKRAVHYDKSGDNHYDTASAFIKSMRGSDPDGTLYWLAKMIYAGEDPKFIARRIMIHAAEDVGLADPQALVIATSAAEAVERIGFPEARIILAQASLYIALAPKSNSVIRGIDSALDAIEKSMNVSIPLHLRDAHYKGAKNLGHGQSYKYPHDFQDNWVDQEYLPKGLQHAKFYKASEQGVERELVERLIHIKDKTKS